MKRCTICHETKDLLCFNKNKVRKDGYNNLCKECSRERSKKYYSENRERHIKVIYKYKKSSLEKKREWMFAFLMEHPCVDCGESDPRALEFDHVKGKKQNVSSLLGSCSSIERIKKEIELCEVRCANCHNIKTAIERNYYTHRLLKPK